MRLPSTVRRSTVDDLTGLAEIVGDARVVTLGENNHQIREFGQLRGRMLRFLVSELGFSVLGFESGFPEGRLIDEWIRGGHGGLDTAALDGFPFRFGESAEIQEMLRWLRAHNADGGRVRFAGLDVPASGGDPLPALQRVRAYLAVHAEAELPLVDAAIAATRPYASANNGLAPMVYEALSEVERDAATTALARLLLRLDALVPGAAAHEHAIARHHALGALRLDEQLRELMLLQGTELPAFVPFSRDVYQAETVKLLRRMAGANERIVLMVHNGHAQRVPMQLLPGVRFNSVGSYLADEFGEDYVAIGLTACTGSTPHLRLDEQKPAGIDVFAQPLDPPAPDSIERVVDETAPGESVLLDLREAAGQPGPGSIRHAHTHSAVDVFTAFDGMVCLPEMTPTSFVPEAAH